jgi:tetratricopeptide (TPR) repeat protein
LVFSLVYGIFNVFKEVKMHIKEDMLPKALVYNVTITPGQKQNQFHLTWYNSANNSQDGFITETNITPEETQRLWLLPQYRLTLGRELFRFLDGDSRHLQRALAAADQKGEPLLLYLQACSQVADWPFELLAQEDTFLLLHRMHLVRRVSDRGTDKDLPPQNRQLKLLFMACSAIDVEPELDFEREEEAIFHITEKLAIDMEVEDSGSLEGLRSKLVHEEYDVVHLSGHADIDKSGRPFFIMEDETGYPREVFAEELWEEALIENPPRLLFLSGCRTGEAPDTGAAVSFARLLVEKYQIPAVLGWGRSVSDEQAILAEKMLYHELSRGKTILDAVQRARHELDTKFQSGSPSAWPLLRLFSSGMSLDAMVTTGQRSRPQHRRTAHVYLGQSQVEVLAEGFVGRRRQLQQCLRTLNQDSNKAGVLLLGTGGLGKSCLAGKTIERFPGHTLIIVHGKLNSITLGAAMGDAFILAQDEKGLQILSQKKEMGAMIKLDRSFCGGPGGGFLEKSPLAVQLAHLCATSFKEKNYLLLLDDFEQNLEGADKGDPGPLLLEAADLLKVLLHWLPYCIKMTQLIITCRYDFSLTEQDKDLVKDRLEKIWLTNFQESERRKKARELKNILNYPDRSLVPRLLSAGYGNPRLMEWVDVLVGQIPAAELPQLWEALADKKETFIRQHLIRELLQQGGKDLSLFLQWLGIYRRPVQIEGVQQLADKAGLKGWKELLQRGMDLSLIEHDQVRGTYQLTPLLREESLKDLKENEACHQAAFAYYKKVCEARESIDPILTEEWIYHALGCSEERAASDQGGRLVKYLQERLAFHESSRVGLWVLDEKKQGLSNEYDAFLLNETAFTLKSLGYYETAIKYYEEALSIDRSIYGQSHPIVARDLNNLGTTLRKLSETEKALGYYEEALRIVQESPGDKPTDIVASLLDNLGSTWSGKGDYRKAIEYHNQALEAWKKLYNEKRPNAAITLNNLGAAWQALGKLDKAAEHYKQALSIDLSVYGKNHIEVATGLNNLGAVCYDQGDSQRAIEYYEEALITWQNIYGEGHPNAAVTMANLGEVYLALDQKEKAREYFKKAYDIFKEFYGTDHSYTQSLANRLTSLG